MTAEMVDVKVLVVAAVRLYRDALCGALRRNGLTVVGEHVDASRLSSNDLTALAPDVILQDMTVHQSTEQIRELVQRAQKVPVVAVGIGDAPAKIIACAEAGITGYVTHGASVEELVEAVRSAARGEVMCSPRLVGVLVRRLADLAAAQRPEMPPLDLTRRERQVARLIKRDLTNKEIAVELGIEVATVKNHVHNLLAKLSVRRRSEAADLLGRAMREVSILSTTLVLSF